MLRSGIFFAALAAAAMSAAGTTPGAELAAMSGKSLASLSDANFDRLARAPNRPYHLFVLFNAKDPQFQCQLCEPFEEEVKVLAESYWMARGKAAEGEVPEVYFAVAEYVPNQKIFKEYNLQSVPMLVHYGPSAGLPHPRGKFSPSSQYVSELDAENAALFVREKTGYKVSIYRSPWRMIFAALTFFGSLGAAAWYMRGSIPQVVSFVQRQTWLWALVGVAFYYISVSGVLYDIIRGVPMVGYDPRTRRAQLISQSSSTQYGAEGLIAGTLNIACGAAVVLLARLFPKFSDSGKRNLAVMAGGIAFVMLYQVIIAMYRYKNGWYDVRLFSLAGFF